MLSGQAIVTGEEIGAAIVVISVMGGEAIKATYRAHEKKVHDKEVTDINDLHQKFLAEICVKGEKLSLPEIFTFKKDKDGKVIGEEPHSMALSDQMLRDLSHSNPVYSDPHLPRYGRHVLNAMSSLREFYKDRFDRDYWHKGAESDAESAVLVYLLLMLSTHCVNFEGHDKATAYLDHLIKFLVNYSDKPGKEEKSDRYDHLKGVVVELRKANFLLQDQMLSLSFETILNEFLTDGRGLIEKMLELGAYFITANDKWKPLEEITPKKIVDGVIKQAYPHYPGFNINGRPAIDFDKTVLFDWLRDCADYYLQSLTTDDCSALNKKMISGGNFDLKKITPQEMKHLTEKLKKCHNFLTLGNLPNMTIKMFAAYIDLLRDMIVSYRFGVLLLDKAMEFGRIYMRNPHHCVAFFKVLHGQGLRVAQSSNAQLMGIKNLEKLNVDSVQAPAKDQLQTDTKELVNTIHRRSIESINTLIARHNDRLKNNTEGIPESLDADDVIDPDKDEFYRLVYDLAGELGIDISASAILADLKAEFASAGSANPKVVSKAMPQQVEQNAALPDASVSQTAATLAVASEQAVHSLHPEAKDAVNHVSGHEAANHEEKSHQLIVAVPALVPAPAPVKNASLKLAEVHMRIDTIKLERQDPKTSRYIAACIALFAENLQALQMWEERPAKYIQLQDMVFTVADGMLQFLNANLEDRLNGAEAFAKKVDERLADAKFLDKHKLSIKQPLGLFKTKSRRLANTIKESCDQIAVVTEAEEEGRQVHAQGLSNSRVLA